MRVNLRIREIVIAKKTKGRISYINNTDSVFDHIHFISQEPREAAARYVAMLGGVIIELVCRRAVGK